MKLQLFLASLGAMFFCSAAHAQCDLHTKTDDFTGKIAVWTNKVKLTNGGTPRLLKGAANFDCTYRIYFKLKYKNERIILSVSEDGDNCYCTIKSISFKFDDGKVLSKENYRIGEEVNTVFGKEQFTFFDLTKEELAMLAAGKIEKFRIRLPGCSDHLVLEEEMDKKTAKNIRDISKCMFQNTTGK